MLSKTCAYVKSYDGQTEWVYFLIKDDDLLEEYNTIWVKVSADIGKGFDNQPVYNKEYLKTKIKSHDDKITDFFDKEISKVDSIYTCLTVISLDFVLKNDESYYSQVFLKGFKYFEKKVVRHIQDNLRDFSYSSYESDGELLGLYFKKCGTLFLNWRMHIKNYFLFLKLCLQCIKIH